MSKSVMISLDDRRPAWHRPAGAQQRCLPVRHKRLAKIIDLAKNLDDPIQHHRLHHSAMAAYLKKLFRHNPLVAQKPLIRVTNPSGLTALNGIARRPALHTGLSPADGECSVEGGRKTQATLA